MYPPQPLTFTMSRTKINSAVNSKDPYLQFDIATGKRCEKCLELREDGHVCGKKPKAKGKKSR